MWAFAFLAIAAAAPFPFAKKTNYDENEARMLLNLAAAAYGLKHDDCLAKTFPQHEERRILSKDLQTCDHLDSTCESYVVTSDSRKELIFVFRGTKTKTQLLLEGWDALQPGVDFFDMGNVNRYFLNAHLKLWPDVEQTLQNTKHRDYKLVFTGHSLGGALATLAAARVVRQGYRTGDNVKLLTFGQPRVGSLEFATNFDNMIKESYRIVFRRDIVPHLPTCAKAEIHLEEESQPCDPTRHDKAYHHGTEIWYPDEMSRGAHYVECTGNPKNEDFECSDRIKFRYDQMNSYIWDHRHYFGVRVPEYGKTGCDATQPEGKPGVFQNLLCWISPSPNCEEHKLAPQPELPVVPLEIINRPWSITNKINGGSSVFSDNSFYLLTLVLLLTLDF